MAFAIAKCLRQANEENKFAVPERADQLAGRLAAVGFTSIREVRMGFPAEEVERAEMSRGLVLELMPDAADSNDLIDLLDAVAQRAVRLAASSLNAPLLRGEFLVPKRSLMGHMVEDVVPSGFAGAQGPAQVVPPCALALGVKRSKILTGLAASVSESLVAPPCASGISLKGKIVASAEKARDKALELLSLVGGDSAVYVEVFGKDGQGSAPGPDTMSVVHSVICGNLEPNALTRYCKEATTYVQWVRSLRSNVTEVGSIMLCSYIRVTLKRGRSIPTVVRSSLIW